MHKCLFAAAAASALLHVPLAGISTRSVASERPAIASFTRVSDSEIERHKAIATDRAEDYIRYEYLVGSVRVTSVRFAVDEIKQVDGWYGRYRTYGRAYVEFFDAGTRSYNRLSRKMEIVTEEKSGKVIKVESVRLSS